MLLSVHQGTVHKCCVRLAVSYSMEYSYSKGPEWAGPMDTGKVDT
jgi:hypothetical protein